MFFYANKAISVDESEFWEKSYQFRQVQCWKLDVEHPNLTSAIPLTNSKKEMGERDSISLSASIKGKEQNNKELQACPLFIKDIAKSIISAGKSLQLIRHFPPSFSVASGKIGDKEIGGFGGSSNDCDLSRCRQSLAGLTLSEIFCVSIAGLIGHGDHISTYFLQGDLYKSGIFPPLVSGMTGKKVENGSSESFPNLTLSQKIWYKYLVDTLMQKKMIDLESTQKDEIAFFDAEQKYVAAGVVDELPLQGSLCPENPVITTCQTLLDKHRDSWKTLNLSRNVYLPPLNDEALREAVFGRESGLFSVVKGTNYAFGFQFGESEYLRSLDDTKLLEVLFPFPTLLPSFQVLLD